MSAIKNLAAAVILQATKDYFRATEEMQSVILNDLRGEWLVFLTDEMSVVVANQLELHPEEIKSRLRTAGGTTMKVCPLTNDRTKCTEHCRDCAKECYRYLKGMSGRADYVSEEAIRNDLGNEAFELMRKYNFIEYCTTIQGRKMYAI
jgi:hypothetical protein